jgi:hypothetical protein
MGMQDTATAKTETRKETDMSTATDKSVMTHQEMMATPHLDLSNGWKVVEATGHVWKWSLRWNRWENWR